MTEAAVKTYPDLSNTDFPVLGPECFTNKDYSIISYQGENYYRACGSFVKGLDDGIQTSCVKRVNHPNISHEDFDGNQKTREPGDAALTYGRGQAPLDD